MCRIFGAGNRIRTDVLFITSELLYQLSHTSKRRKTPKQNRPESNSMYSIAYFKTKCNEKSVTFFSFS